MTSGKELLNQQYAEAFTEWEESGEAKRWDRAVADGLEPESWPY